MLTGQGSAFGFHFSFRRFVAGYTLSSFPVLNSIPKGTILAFPTDPRPPTVRSRENCPWAPLASCVSQSHGSPCPSPSPQGHGGSEKDNPQESRAGSEARAGPRSRQPHAPSVPPTAPPPPIADTLAGGNGHTWQQVRFVLSILQRLRVSMGAC